MKKIILASTLAVALLSSNFIYAANIEPSVKVKQAFISEFTKATNVEWTTLSKEGVYQAKFVLNNEILEAFFSEEGDFLGTTRQITAAQLPILVTTSLEKKYADSRIVTIFEYSKKDGLDYYITLTSAKGAVVVKASGNGDIYLYKKNIK